jgi:hypothetical protein
VKYVIHENALRASLAKLQGHPLSEWKRTFILDPIFRNATRPSVIGISSVKSVLKQGWMKSRFLHSDSGSVQTNTEVMTEFVSALRKVSSPAANPSTWVDKRESSKKHVLYKNVKLNDVVELLTNMHFADSRDMSSFLLFQICALNALDRKADLTADIVLINDLDTSKLQTRELGYDEPLDNIFIGRAPQKASLNDLKYVGDEKIYTANTTIHLRFAKIENPDTKVISFVPWISIRPSEDLATAILEEKE